MLNAELLSAFHSINFLMTIMLIVDFLHVVH